MNSESYCRTSKVATISHGPSVRHRSCGHLGATLDWHQRRSGGSWRGVPKRLNNGVHSSMQKQTQKRFKSGFKMMNGFHFRGGWKYYASCPLHTTLFTVLTCAQRTRVYFCPQHWLLCHLGLYQFEFGWLGSAIL